jgi:hypothetical protein
MYKCLHAKYPSSLSDFNQPLIYSTDFRKIIPLASVHWEPSCSIRADGGTDGRTEGRTGGRTEGQTDMMKLTVTFRNFGKAPANAANICYRSVRVLLSLYCSKTEDLNEDKTRKMSTCLV